MLTHTLVEQDNLAQFGPIKINDFGEQYLYKLNQGSFDKVSACALFDAKFSESLLKENTLTLIVGTDSGLLPKYLCQKGLPSGSRFIFIEPKCVLAELQQQDLLADLPTEIACCSFDDWEQQAREFKIGDYFYITAVQSFNSICAQEANFEDYAEISWLLTEKLGQLHWQYSMSLGSESFLIRQMQNLTDNCLPASILKGAFNHQTVMILAGGPSLDDSLDWIKQHRKQVILFAVSRIARQLIQNQIEPDFIFSVDPSDLSFDISKEMLTFSNKPIFVYSYHTVPTLVNQWHGTRLFLGERIPWTTPLNKTNLSGAGPTVTNTAISAAHAFGFKRIILAGVDLCFTRDGYTHAKGSNEALAGPRFNLTSLQVETNAGENAPSSCDFISAIQSLHLQAKILTQDGCTLINYAANAAKISGIDYCPLNQIPLSDNLVEPSTIVDERIKQAKLNTEHEQTSLVQELKRAQYQIKSIQKLAQRANIINDAMYNSQGVIENYKDKRELDKIEQKLKRQYRKYSVLVKTFGIRAFIKITRPFDDIDLSAKDAQALCKIYYTAYDEGAKHLLNLIAGALERFEVRHEENQANPDFDRIFSQWSKDQSYGRAKLWAEKQLTLPQSIQDQLQDFNTKFQGIIDNNNTLHLARTKQHSSLKAFKSRAKILFKHGKITELEDLAKGLAQHTDIDAAPAYRHFAEGFVAELKGDTSNAINHYHQIIDSSEQALYEDVLLRIAHLSLEVADYQNASLALQCLADISAIHIPFYAEIHRLLGYPEAASELYYDYIKQFPNDILAQLKLASLHIENQSYPSAEVMLDYILTTNPQNTAALELKSQLTKLSRTQSEKSPAEA